MLLLIYLLRSPSGQLLHSPANSMGGMPVRAPGSLGPAPSPGSSLNTPGWHTHPPLTHIQTCRYENERLNVYWFASFPPRHCVGAPSPVRQFSDNQAYMEKLKSLQKYIEPLRRMIYRIDKEGKMRFDLIDQDGSRQIFNPYGSRRHKQEGSESAEESPEQLIQPFASVMFYLEHSLIIVSR